MKKRDKGSTLTPFAVNLKKLLEERKISARAAAQLAGIAPSTLSQWTAGISPQDLEAVQRLAVALDVDFQFLLLGTQPIKKPQSMDELFEVSNEASMSGLFQIDIRRLKPKVGQKK